MNIQPITLSGESVRLEPLSEIYVSDLTQIGRDKSIWRYMLYGDIADETAMRGFVQDLLKRAEQGTDLPFVVIHQESNRPVGCTRYLNISRTNKSLEIGGTWYGLEFQRTKVNTECKYLLLKHAFENLRCIRVQLKTDSRNIRSQRAIERIGAVKEGILRNHMILPDGYVRDSVFYSIIFSEWPVVKKLLEAKLAQTFS